MKNSIVIAENASGMKMAIDLNSISRIVVADSVDRIYIAGYDGYVNVPKKHLLFYKFLNFKGEYKMETEEKDINNETEEEEKRVNLFFDSRLGKYVAVEVGCIESIYYTELPIICNLPEKIFKNFMNYIETTESSATIKNFKSQLMAQLFFKEFIKQTKN